MSRIAGKRLRDYSDVENRIGNLNQVHPNIRIEVLDTVVYRQRSYPIYWITLPAIEESPQDVFLSGGVHGDEPAGVEALLQFLEKGAATYLDRYQFHIIVCANPSGWEANEALSDTGSNPNREFKTDTSSSENQIIMRALQEKNIQFRFAMDMHEIPPDWESEGWKKSDNPETTYLYETQSAVNQRVGKAMIEGLPQDAQVCSWDKIYGDTAVGGLVSYPEACANPFYAAGTTLDGFIFGRYSQHTFTTETPTSWPLEMRLRTQLSYLFSALEKLAP